MNNCFKNGEPSELVPTCSIVRTQTSACSHIPPSGAWKLEPSIRPLVQFHPPLGASFWSSASQAEAVSDNPCMRCTAKHSNKLLNIMIKRTIITRCWKKFLMHNYSNFGLYFWKYLKYSFRIKNKMWEKSSERAFLWHNSCNRTGVTYVKKFHSRFNNGCNGGCWWTHWVQLLLGQRGQTCSRNKQTGKTYV